jgi:hypothetical protein
VLYGGPIAFLLLGILLVLWVLGPAPPRNPVDLIRKGMVKQGMNEAQVIAAVGQPKGVEPRDDGGKTFRYRHATTEPFVEEDAYVDLNRDGYVIGTTIERTNVRPPE